MSFLLRLGVNCSKGGLVSGVFPAAPVWVASGCRMGQLLIHLGGLPKYSLQDLDAFV